jgi:hypothetical protein
MKDQGRITPVIDVLDFRMIWNDRCGGLPRVREMTKSRINRLRARRCSPTFEQDFTAAVTKAASTPFLLGENDRGWKANFDWLIANDKTTSQYWRENTMESLQEIAPRVVRSLAQMAPRDMNEKPTSLYELASCARCKDTGWISAGDHRAMRCPCLLERVIRDVLPARYRNSSLEDFPEDFSQFIRDWIGQSPTPSLLLTGPTGTGKTHMAAAIVRLRVETKGPILFKRASAFYSAVRESFSQPNVSEADVMRKYGEYPMLVLDDLGSGSLSDHERRSTLELLEMRSDDFRPTVVTTNWTIEQIGERMDDRIASRLSEFKLLRFEGKDRRRLRGR